VHLTDSYKYYVSGAYPLSCFYLKHSPVFTFQNTTFLGLDSVSVFRQNQSIELVPISKTLYFEI
jgi:hypothetical protein